MKIQQITTDSTTGPLPSPICGQCRSGDPAILKISLISLHQICILLYGVASPITPSRPLRHIHFILFPPHLYRRRCPVKALLHSLMQLVRHTCSNLALFLHGTWGLWEDRHPSMVPPWIPIPRRGTILHKASRRYGKKNITIKRIHLDQFIASGVLKTVIPNLERSPVHGLYWSRKMDMSILSRHILIPTACLPVHN